MEKQQLSDIIKSKQSLNMSEEEYREYEAVNYSTLSTLDRTPHLVGKETPSTDAMNLGSIVDMMLTGQDYSKKFVPLTVEKPTGQLGQFCDFILEGMSSEQAFAAVNSKKYKFETMFKDYNEKGGVSYVAQMLKAEDKTLVPFEMISKANHIVSVLRNHEFTKFFFVENENPDVKIFYQVPLVFDLPSGQEMFREGKALIDILVVDFENKIIIPVDLKTSSGKASEFKSSFFKWRYYLQASFYHYGLSSVTDFHVEPFKFIVASTTDLERPSIWNCSNKDLHIGRFGGKSPLGSELSGWEGLIDDLAWHTQKDKWDYSREVYDNFGQQIINAFEEW